MVATFCVRINSTVHGEGCLLPVLEGEHLHEDGGISQNFACEVIKITNGVASPCIHKGVNARVEVIIAWIAKFHHNVEEFSIKLD